jgi:hypothetical protein
MSEVSLREQVVKRWPKCHGVDDKFAVVCEGQNDHFKELAIRARTDHEHFRGISVGVHVDDDKRVVDSVDDLVWCDAVSAR